MADGNENEASRLLGEWRQNVMDSLKSVHHKLDDFDERLRLIEVGVIQKTQIEKLEREVSDLRKELNTRVGSLEGYKQRLLGYALGVGAVAGVVFELVKLIWPH